jgi:PKD repeat protein
MKRIVTLLFLFLFVAGAYSQTGGWRKGEMETKIYLDKPGDGAILRTLRLETEGASPNGSVVNAYVTPPELETIKASGLRYAISIPDLNAYYEGFWDRLVPPGYHTYDQIVALADSLAAAFPSICKKVGMGTSAGNHQLAALKISDNVNTDEGEPEIMFDGGIHGDEVGGPENMIRFARDLCTGYGTDTTYTELINTREIWLYYMVNPDGRVNMDRYNGNGVDVNRDFGYMWNAEGNSMGAFSQPESRSLRNCLLDNQFVVYTNYHSGTEIVAYPWSYRTNATADNAHINNLAWLYSNTSGYPSLQYGQGYNVMYAINGSTKDFQYGSLGDVGWSIEISNDKQPPQSQIMLYYNYNLPAMVEMIRRAGYGVEGVVTDSTTGIPVRATVWVSNFFPVNTDPLVGDYHKYVLPGSCSLKVTANGFKTKTVTGVNVPAVNSLVTDFQLIPDSNYNVFRVISCQIPNNNFSDPGYTPGVLGRPDGVAYAMGRNGWIVLDMGDTVYNGSGNDLRVVEASTAQKGYTCYAGTTPDGPWITLGTGIGTAEFDLSAGSLNKVRYLKIKDDGDGPSQGLGIGFDLDAVEMITLPLVSNFACNNDIVCKGAPVSFTDESTGRPTAWNWQFPGGVPSSSTEKNPSGIVYPFTGTYDVSLTVTNAFGTQTKTRSSYIQVRNMPYVNLGNDTSILASSSLTLDAGNPGCSYIWSTGATTQTITIDTTGIGLGAHAFSVEVTNSEGCTATDVIVVTFSINIGIAGAPDRQSVTVFPNPSTGHAHLRLEGSNGGTFRIRSVLGNVVLAQPISTINYSGDLDLSAFPKGIYFLEISDGKQTFTRKLILE